MVAQRRESSGRIGPIIWGTIAVVLVAALGVSFLLSRQALSDARGAAEDRAEQFTGTVLRSALTPETTASDITGASYRTLLGRIQQDILSDERVVRVRIWRPNGDLIFSTDPADAVADVVEDDDARILQAGTGQTVSTVSEPVVPARDGLAGTDERLLETFVTLHLENEPGTSGVAQVDHRYVDIEEEVYRVWRPTQLGLVAGLGVSLVLLVITALGRRRRDEVAPARRGAAAPSAAPSESSRVRKAEERAAAAEKTAREAERKLAETERQLAIAEQRLGESEDVGSAVSASVAKRVEELEERLRVEQAERERSQGEVQRVQSVLTRKEAELEQAGTEVQRLLATLSKKETELAAVREGIQGVEAETARSKGVLSTAEARAVEAERRASEAESAADAVRQAADELERRVAAAETRAEEAERRATDAQRTAVELEARARAAEEAVSQASAAAPAEGEEVGELETRLAATVDELEEARLALETKDEELAAMAQEVGRLTSEMVAASASEDGAGTAATPSEDGARTSELEARVRELEDQRRVDVSELQRAHEMLANTQAELAQTSRRLKEAETIALQAARREPVLEEAPEPVPPPAPKRRASRRSPIVEPEAGRAPAPAVEEAPPEPEPLEMEEEPDLEEEGLSLRERLTRAAAARHRTLGKPDA